MDSYVVVEVYYKRGEYDIRTLKSEKLLREDIISCLEDYDTREDRSFESNLLNNLPWLILAGEN